MKETVGPCFIRVVWWFASILDMSLMPSSKAWPALFALLLLALIVQAAIIYPRLKGKNAEIASLREATQAQALLESEPVDPQMAVQAEELTRLRKDNQELHRLRNEVRQLREASQQAAKAAQPTATAPATAELLGQLQRQVQQLQTENAQLRAAHQEHIQIRAEANVAAAQANACINNLRMIDGAKQQWALENALTAEAVPQPADIEPYLRDSVIPACPAGGVYTLNAVGLQPLCSVPGHSLQ